jgi:uncharacterized protein YukE
MIAVLIRFAQQVVQMVMQQATQQMNVVLEQAFNPIQATVQLVQGGAWKGIGADAFVEEVQSLHMPGVSLIGEQIREMVSNLQQAGEIMMEADKQANQAVRSLDELFGRIAGF